MFIKETDLDKVDSLSGGTLRVVTRSGESAQMAPQDLISEFGGPISPLRGSLFSASSGAQNQWIYPLAASRAERGTPVAYVGSTDDQSNQIVTRINTVTGESESKVVYSGYIPDDHNAPAIKFLPSGDILIACAGHNEAPAVHYGVFRSWGDVTTLPNSLSWSDRTTYIQIYTLDNVTVLMTRLGNTKWAARYSADGGLSWSNEAILAEHTTQVYVWGVELLRSTQEIKSENYDIVRLVFYPHPTKPGKKEIRKTEIRTFFGLPAIGTAATGYRSFDDLASLESSPWAFSDLPALWGPPPGKSCRLFDLAQSEDFLTLVCEFDEAAPHGNARYLLLEGCTSPDAIEIPIRPGEDLPHDTYFPGACFIRKRGSDHIAAGSVEIVVSSNHDDIDGKHTVSYLKRNSAGFDVVKLFESERPLFRPFAVDGGNNADVCISEFSHYNGYRDFSGSTHLVSGAVNKFENTVQLLAGSVENDRWSTMAGGVCLQGGTHQPSSSSGAIELKVPLREILHVSYDDIHGTSKPVTIATKGRYSSYKKYLSSGEGLSPITQINWRATGNVLSFSWMVIGIPY